MTRALRMAAALVAATVFTGCSAALPAPTPSFGTASSPTASDAAALTELTSAAFSDRGLTSLVAQVRVDGEIVGTVALGESMTGVAATADDRFRNGAVAMAYVTITMLAMSDAGLLDIDAPIRRWLPDADRADAVTPRMLASMTSGYPDYVAADAFVDAVSADPFRAWTEDELLAFSADSPRLFAPGENWDYSHAGFVVLGRVLAAAGDAPLDELIARYVLDPLSLRGTTASATAAIPDPVQHGFTAERGVFEDSTFWNPSWTLPAGAVQTTTVTDMAAGFDAVIGRGELLSASAYDALISTERAGFGHPLDGCRACLTLTEDWNYGLGVFLRGDWVLQTPLFGGYQAAVATLPASRSTRGAITVAVSVVAGEDTYPDWSARLENIAAHLATDIATRLSPDVPPPAYADPS